MRTSAPVGMTSVADDSTFQVTLSPSKVASQVSSSVHPLDGVAVSVVAGYTLTAAVVPSGYSGEGEPGWGTSCTIQSWPLESRTVTAIGSQPNATVTPHRPS